MRPGQGSVIWRGWGWVGGVVTVAEMGPLPWRSRGGGGGDGIFSNFREPPKKCLLSAAAIFKISLSFYLSFTHTHSTYAHFLYFLPFLDSFLVSRLPFCTISFPLFLSSIIPFLGILVMLQKFHLATWLNVWCDKVISMHYNLLRESVFLSLKTLSHRAMRRVA